MNSLCDLCVSVFSALTTLAAILNAEIAETQRSQRVLLGQSFLALLNEPSFLRYIGDKKVRNIDDAQQYILNGPIGSYKQNGFGLYLVELKDSRTPIGICGLIKRAELPDVDIGFAFLPDFWSQGFAMRLQPLL